MSTPAWPDGDDPMFREVFEEALKASNLPTKRKGELYESTYSRTAFLIAYSVVNRIGKRLAASAPVAVSPVAEAQGAATVQPAECPYCGKPLINCKCWGEVRSDAEWIQGMHDAARWRFVRDATSNRVPHLSIYPAGAVGVGGWTVAVDKARFAEIKDATLSAQPSAPVAPAEGEDQTVIAVAATLHRSGETIEDALIMAKAAVAALESTAKPPAQAGMEGERNGTN